MTMVSAESSFNVRNHPSPCASVHSLSLSSISTSNGLRIEWADRYITHATAKHGSCAETVHTQAPSLARASHHRMDDSTFSCVTSTLIGRSRDAPALTASSARALATSSSVLVRASPTSPTNYFASDRRGTIIRRERLRNNTCLSFDAPIFVLNLDHASSAAGCGLTRPRGQKASGSRPRELGASRVPSRFRTVGWTTCNGVAGCRRAKTFVLDCTRQSSSVSTRAMDCRNKVWCFWLCRWGAAASAPEPRRGPQTARQHRCRIGRGGLSWEKSVHRRAKLPLLFD